LLRATNYRPGGMDIQKRHGVEVESDCCAVAANSRVWHKARLHLPSTVRPLNPALRSSDDRVGTAALRFGVNPPENLQQQERNADPG